MVSLPLMGIGNRLATDALKGMRLDSLPLMGIGNQALPCFDSTGPFSLPLMGIGNLPVTLIGDGDEFHSLPLMGIGNGGGRRRIGPHRDLLITPHGDR